MSDRHSQISELLALRDGEPADVSRLAGMSEQDQDAALEQLRDIKQAINALPDVAVDDEFVDQRDPCAAALRLVALPDGDSGVGFSGHSYRYLSGGRSVWRVGTGARSGRWLAADAGLHPRTFRTAACWIHDAVP